MFTVDVTQQHYNNSKHVKEVVVYVVQKKGILLFIFKTSFHLFRIKHLCLHFLFPDLSATMRRISLATRIVAPIVIGQILSRTSHPIGALVVAGWNFMTIFLEYFLLWKIYNDVPQLHRFKVRGRTVLTQKEIADLYLVCRQKDTFLKTI